MEERLKNNNIDSDEFKFTNLIFPDPKVQEEIFINKIQESLYNNMGIPKELIDRLPTIPSIHNNVNINNDDMNNIDSNTIVTATELVKANAPNITKTRQFCLEVKKLAAAYELPFFVVAGTSLRDRHLILNMKRFVDKWESDHPGTKSLTGYSDEIDEMDRNLSKVYGTKLANIIFDEFLKDPKPQPISDHMEE